MNSPEALPAGTIRLAGNPLDGARARVVRSYAEGRGLTVRLEEGRGRWYAGAEVILDGRQFAPDAADLPAAAGSC